MFGSSLWSSIPLVYSYELEAILLLQRYQLNSSKLNSFNSQLQLELVLRLSLLSIKLFNFLINVSPYDCLLSVLGNVFLIFTLLAQELFRSIRTMWSSREVCTIRL